MKIWTVVRWLDSSSELPISSDSMRPLRAIDPLFQCGPEILAKILNVIKHHIAFRNASECHKCQTSEEK